MRYRLVRFVVLVVAPYWYLRMYLAGTKVRPSDYFLQLLTKKKGRCTQAILFVIVLSIAARSFDAVMTLRATKSLRSPFFLWVLSVRDIRLMLEASLWLGAAGDFDVLRQEVLRQAGSSSKVRSLLSFYESLSRNEIDLIDTIRAQLVLPALFWDRVAAKSFSDGQVRESADALHQALRFVPEGDPRRKELVARFLQAEAILHGRAEL